MPEENLTPENIEDAAQAASDAAGNAAQAIDEAATSAPPQPFSQPYEQPVQVDPVQVDPAQQQYAQPQYTQPFDQQQQYTQPQYEQQPQQEYAQPFDQQQYQQQQYTQQQYQQPVYAQPTQASYAPGADPGTTPLVLGVLSLVAVLVFGLTFIGPIAGIVLGALGMSKGKKVLQSWPENGRAKGGRITGIIGLVLSIFALVVSIVFIVFVGSVTMQALEDPDAFISQMEEIVQYDETGALQEQLDELEQQLNELEGLSQGSKPNAAPFLMYAPVGDMKTLPPVL